MKLIYCKECGDIFNLTYEEKQCECGNSKGRYYEDGLHAYYTGSSIPLGFSNPHFFLALDMQPEEGLGYEFSAFVIPKECKTFKKK